MTETETRQIELFESILVHFKYKDWKFVLRPFPGYGWSLVIIVNTKCNFTGRDITVQHVDGIDFYPNFDEQWYLEYLRRRVIRIGIHEAEEQMQYKGERIFNPHTR